MIFRLCASAGLLAAAIVLAAGPAAARPSQPTDPNLSRFGPNAIVVRHSERALYLVRPGGGVIRYRVAVGKPGKQWFGQTEIRGKYVDPDWSPPAAVKRDHPSLPNLIAGGTPKNPMGPRAMVLARGQYAIHGTNRPQSIGTFASYGCIRMLNDDIKDLYERVSVGQKVVVIP